MPDPRDLDATITSIVDAVKDLSGFAAMSFGGSTQAGFADEASDLDIHVWWRAPLATPDERAARLASCADRDSLTVGITSWGLEDSLAVDGRPVELIYFNLDELKTLADQAYDTGLNSEGYATALLYLVAAGRPIHDPTGALRALRERLNDEFPEATRTTLLRQHPPLLRVYLDHLRLAQRRADLLAVQHRRYTLQMVFFNLLFTLNRRFHPGEKRLLLHMERCPIRPGDCARRWNNAARLQADDPALAVELHSLVEDLIRLIERDTGMLVAAHP